MYVTFFTDQDRLVAYFRSFPRKRESRFFCEMRLDPRFRGMSEGRFGRSFCASRNNQPAGTRNDLDCCAAIESARGIIEISP